MSAYPTDVAANKHDILCFSSFAKAVRNGNANGGIASLETTDALISSLQHAALLSSDQLRLNRLRRDMTKLLSLYTYRDTPSVPFSSGLMVWSPARRGLFDLLAMPANGENRGGPLRISTIAVKLPSAIAPKDDARRRNSESFRNLMKFLRRNDLVAMLVPDSARRVCFFVPNASQYASEAGLENDVEFAATLYYAQVDDFILLAETVEREQRDPGNSEALLQAQPPNRVADREEDGELEDGEMVLDRQRDLVRVLEPMETLQLRTRLANEFQNTQNISSIITLIQQRCSLDGMEQELSLILRTSSSGSVSRVIRCIKSCLLTFHPRVLPYEGDAMEETSREASTGDASLENASSVTNSANDVSENGVSENASSTKDDASASAGNTTQEIVSSASASTKDDALAGDTTLENASSLTTDSTMDDVSISFSQEDALGAGDADTKKHCDLLARLLKYMSSRAAKKKRITTREILDQFEDVPESDGPVLRSLLKSVATFQPKGGWVLVDVCLKVDLEDIVRIATSSVASSSISAMASKRERSNTEEVTESHCDRKKRPRVSLVDASLVVASSARVPIRYGSRPMNPANLLGAGILFPAPNENEERREAIIVGVNLKGNYRYFCNGEVGVIDLIGGEGQGILCPRPKAEENTYDANLQRSGSGTSSPYAPVIARSRQSTPVSASYYLHPDTKQPLFVEEVTTHQNQALAEISTFWNELMELAARRGIRTVWGDFLNWIMPFVSDFLLGNLGKDDPLYFFLYCYSPLAIHTNCIGRLQSSEARGPDGQLTAASWRYHEHGMTPELMKRGIPMDGNIGSFRYKGSYEEILSEEDAAFVRDMQASLIRKILNTKGAKVQLLSKSALRVVAAALGDEGEERAKLDAFHRANEGRLVSVDRDRVTNMRHAEVFLNDEFVRERNRDFGHYLSKAWSLENDMLITYLKTEMGKDFGIEAAPCTVTMDLFQNNNTAATQALDESKMVGTFEFLRTNANSIVPALHESNPASVIAYVMNNAEEILEMFPHLKSIEEAAVLHPHRLMSSRGGHESWDAKRRTLSESSGLSMEEAGSILMDNVRSFKSEESEALRIENISKTMKEIADKAWMEMVDKLIYFATNNPSLGCRVPKATTAEMAKTYEEELKGWSKKLAGWVVNQRLRKKGKGDCTPLTAEQVSLLEKIGFEWNPGQGTKVEWR